MTTYNFGSGNQTTSFEAENLAEAKEKFAQYYGHSSYASYCASNPDEPEIEVNGFRVQ